jgi:AmmeMemoRadiSam system protein B
MTIHPNVAGKFYPDNPDILRKNVLHLLSDAINKNYDKVAIPKAIIAPHAVYIYSGLIAASAYACLIKAKKKINQVIILAPSHQYPVDGIATTSADSYLNH